MITFFTIPKPFKGHISVIQRNAIISWHQLHPDCEIILYGDEEGIKEIADEFGLIHIPDIEKNEHGTPFLDFVFNDAQSRAKNNILCYANTDIIFFKDFINSIQSVKKDPFLIVGQRWDVVIPDPLSFSDNRWEENLHSIVERKGICSGPWAIDYFAFSKTVPLRLLHFLVGRSGWDNWMIYYARKKGIPAVDISQTTIVIHQNHDYNHVPFKKGEKWDGPESDYNMNLIGNNIVQQSNLCMWRIDGTEYILTYDGLVKREKGIYKKIIEKSAVFCPNFLYPLIGFFILKIHRRTGVDWQQD